jgi:hypothetical protein
VAQGLREQLIGAWKLVSYEERPVDGSPPFYPMSEKPMGIIMYTPDGYMSAQLMSQAANHLPPAIGSKGPRRNMGGRQQRILPILASSTSTKQRKS